MNDISKNNSPIIPIILSGGEGKRLWPRSRSSMPKQYHALFNEFSLLQNTVILSEKLKANHPEALPPIIVANANRRFTLIDQLNALKDSDISISQIIYEPFGKNTAPAVAVAILSILEDYPDARCICLPVDHLLDEAILEPLNTCMDFLDAQDVLTTIGINPTQPSPQYGYLAAGEAIDSQMIWLNHFVEKPDILTATEYLSQGYLWNSGIYCFKAQALLQQFQDLQPELLQQCQQALAQSDPNAVENELALPNCRQRILAIADYEQVPSCSFDVAISEQVEQIACCPYDGLWSDIGSWKAMYEFSPKNDEGNVISGQTLAYESHDNYLYHETGAGPVVTLGLNQCYVVALPDVTFIAHKDHLDQMGELHAALGERFPELSKFSNTVYRPWGSFENLLSEKNTCIKRIFVNPLRRLSLQSHEHRSEHWLIVSGTALVTLDQHILTLNAGESIDIPIQAKHRLENCSENEPLVVVEVQRGDKLSEDDITRYEDDFQRDSETC